MTNKNDKVINVICKQLTGQVGTAYSRRAIRNVSNGQVFRIYRWSKICTGSRLHKPNFKFIRTPPVDVTQHIVGYSSWQRY